jgi:hypothetical protein
MLNSSTASARKVVVWLILVVYWLLLTEGALRKWLLPDYHKILFFIRDPFVVAAYFYAIRYRLWPKENFALLVSLGVAVFFLCLLPLQLYATRADAVVLLYGWRNYFFYIPLMFLVGNVMQPSDVRMVARHTLYASIPIAILVAWQFISPPDAFVNKAVTEEALVFGLAEGIVRTTGLFTFTLGQSLFVATLAAFLTWTVAAWRTNRPLSPGALVLVLVAFAFNLVLSGSRLAVVYAGLFFLLLVIHQVAHVRRPGTIRGVMVLIAIVVGFALVLPDFVTEAWQARVEDAQASGDSIVGRIGSGMTSFFGYVADSPALGFGIGYGTGGGATVMTGSGDFTLVEEELPRIILEAGPIFGFAYVVLRLFLMCYLGARVIGAWRKSHDMLGIALLLFVVPQFLQGPMTGQGTVMAYAWLFAGFALAASKWRLSAFGSPNVAVKIDHAPASTSMPAKSP